MDLDKVRVYQFIMIYYPPPPPIVQVKVVHNQPYDESVEVSDGEEITSNNPTPRVLTTDQQGMYIYTHSSLLKIRRGMALTWPQPFGSGAPASMNLTSIIIHYAHQYNTKL